MKNAMTIDQSITAYLIRNVRRAQTVHAKAQERGAADMSVRQTRRMALAQKGLAKWCGALARHERSMALRGVRS